MSFVVTRVLSSATAKRLLLISSGVLLGVTLVAVPLSYWPGLPFYTIMFPRKGQWDPECSAFFGIRPFEISLYQGSLVLNWYTFGGANRFPQAGWGRYIGWEETAVSRPTWRAGHSQYLFNSPVMLLVHIHLAWFSLVAVLWPLYYWAIPYLRWRRAEQRRARGLCGSCGYNLAYNISGRCPECGTETSDGHTVLAGTARTPRAGPDKPPLWFLVLTRATLCGYIGYFLWWGFVHLFGPVSSLRSSCFPVVLARYIEPGVFVLGAFLGVVLFVRVGLRGRKPVESCAPHA